MMMMLISEMMASSEDKNYFDIASNVFHSHRALGGLVDLEVNVDPTLQVEQKETIH